MTIEELKVVISAETSELKSALKEVQSSVKSIGSYVRKQTSAITGSINSSVKKISSSFKSLGSIITKALSAAALLALGKSAIGLASDIEEVQNVVNVAFGDMAAQAEFFAQRCASAFGLSELMAKRTSSTYMAMATAMNLSRDAAKTMSLQLTALSGDMASFYNVQQSVADTALKSVFTGETETLKKFGIVMTEANLEAYRLAQGIKKSYSEMSQAEKVALRYNYVMQNTSLAQGDFVRTSSSWANQIRILKMRWEELMASMGTILTHVLIPIIQALNVILSQIVSIAKGFAAMFAPKAETEQITSMGAGFSSVTDNIEDATDAAKKYKRTVAGFDELNLLKDPNADSGAGAAGGAGLNMEIAEPYDFNALAGSTEDAKISLQKIIDGFNQFISNLNIKLQESKDVVGSWGKGFASAINKVVDGISWSTIGQTIGNGLNLIFGFIKNFRQELDAYDIGAAIATMISNIVNTIDWDTIADMVILGFNNMVSGLSGFIANLKIVDLVENLTKFFRRVAEEVNWQGLAESISWLLNYAIFTAYSLVTNVDFKLFATKIFEGIKAGLESIDWQMLGATIRELILQTLDALKESGLAEEIGKSIGEFLKGLDLWAIFGGLRDTLGDVLADIFSGLTGIEDGKFINAIADIVATLLLIAPVIMKIASASAVLNLGGIYKILSLIGRGILGIPALLGNIVFGTKNLSDAAKEAGGIIEKVKISFRGLTGVMENGGTVFKSWATIGKEAITAVKNAISTFVTNASNLFTTLKTSATTIVTAIKTGAITAFESLKAGVLTAGTVLKSGIITALGAIKTAISTTISFIIANPIVLIIAAIVALVALIATKGDEIQAALKKVTSFLTGIFTKDWTEVFGPVLGNILNGFSKAFGDIWNGIQEILNGVIDVIRGVFTGDWERAWEGVKSIFKGIWDSLVGIVKAPINIIIGFINGMLEGIEKAVNKIIDVLNKLSFDVPDWVPLIGGKTFGFNLKTITISKIPQLADGGVVYESTIANVGEYAGAKHNPEIVTPQSLMQETMETAMLPMINAYVAMGNRILKAIEDKDLDVYMDTTKVTRKITKEQNNQAKYKGTSLVLV